MVARTLVPIVPLVVLQVVLVALPVVLLLRPLLTLLLVVSARRATLELLLRLLLLSLVFCKGALGEFMEGRNVCFFAVIPILG